MLGGYGDGPIGTAHDGALVVKGIGGAEIEDKSRVLGRASEGDGGARLDAKGFVGLGAGDTRGGACGGSFTAADVARAGGRSRTAGDFRGTNACRIRGRADIVFDLLFGVLTDDVEVQEYGQNEQSSTSV